MPYNISKCFITFCTLYLLLQGRVDIVVEATRVNFRLWQDRFTTYEMPQYRKCFGSHAVSLSLIPISR